MEKKTCVDCYHNAECNGNKGAFRGGVCLYMATGILDAFHPNCGGLYWKERTDTIEQRYEQLEQVAKEMYQVIDEAMNREQYVCNLGDSERMKSSLKALGVEV